MEFFSFFANSFVGQIYYITLGCYVLVSLFFCAVICSEKELAFPSMLNAVSQFSCFVVCLLLFDCLFNLGTSTQLVQYHVYSMLFLCFFLVASLLTLLANIDFMNASNLNKFEYDALFCFVLFSSICLCFANDFLTFYLAIELQSLSLYVFASFSRNSEFSTESGLKYFIFGAVISCFLLFGISLIYLCFGTVSFEFLFKLINKSNNLLPLIGVLFILITFFFKTGSAPFHTWLTEVYDGAILPVTMLFAVVPKIIIFSILVKLFLSILVDLKNVWLAFFLVGSLASIILGTFAAIYQKRLKRLFAYSTIAHSGFILLGIVASNTDAISSITFYIMVYSLLTVLLFSLLIFSSVSVTNFPAYLSSWTSNALKNYNFIIALCFVLFSIAGIPPLIGFFTKFFVIFSLVSEQFFVTSFLVVITSSLACFYYIRLIKTFFFTKYSKNGFWISNTKRQATEYVVSVLLFFNVAFVFYPGPISLLADVMGLCLL